MTSKEIEDNLIKLVNDLGPDDFIYDFLLSYGISKTSITRLKKGDFNLSKVSGAVLYKNKVFFNVASHDQLLIKTEEYSKTDEIIKHRPRFIIVTDFKTLVAKDLKTGINRDINLIELPKYFDFFLPLTGAEIYKASNDNKADRDAAYQLAKLYDILVTDDPDILLEGTHQLNLFLSRLLFCFFAEDTGIFEKESIFTETLANNTSENGSDLHEFLHSLFQKLNSEHGNFPSYLNAFPYVNGGLFRDDIRSPRFSRKSRDILLECGNLQWSEINPDIFGSMIQAVADPEERSDLGMHYTSVPNIKKLIEPLFLNDLYNEFNRNQNSITGLKKLINRISKIKFFDPACGSGNFLIITYKEIRLLEIKIIQRLVDLDAEQGKKLLYFTSVQLSQFYGIEIKDFAHEMALLSLWLAEHQMNKIFEEMLEGYGQSKPILPLKEAGHIICENSLNVNWSSVCSKSKTDEIYVIGNPPYLGARVQAEDQKKDMDAIFGHLQKYRDLDYISCWFYKAKQYLEGFNIKCAFVSTNSITQGQQVSLLWPNILSGKVEIDFAYDSFKWTNNAKGNAGVSVVIIGLRNSCNLPKYLYDARIRKEVKNINAYLIDSSDIYIYESGKSISKFPRMNFGNMPNDGGGLILSESEKDDLLRNNVSAGRYLRRLLGSHEFLNGNKRYCLWIEDVDLDDAKQISLIKSRIDIVTNHRLKSKDAGTKQLASRSHQFRDRNTAIENQLIVPGVSSQRREYIPMGFLDSNTIVSNSALVVYDAQSWLFGILHSKMHMVWVDTVGGKLKTDYRYSAKLCYNTFPLPDISNKQKETVSQYVFQVLDERAKYPEKTMAWLYNPETMPLGLRQAHRELDEAVDRLYRLSPFQNDVERLEYLFKLYEEMTKKNTLFAKQKIQKARNKTA
ncbi:MAG: class I SAM-dependent DNA methyltransferase [Bacteroidetes bacterium]|nr:class I SAM-dependent DNA methyltransferase [Bacteroidota bacterium]